MALLLFCSGAAALTHQVAWVRLLGLSLGSSSAAIATVLTAFFGGMAAGSWLAGRLSRGGGVDLRRVAWLEGVVAVTGLLLLPALLQVDALLARLPALGTWLPARFALCAGLLGVPTLCMGAVFPLVAGALASGTRGPGGELARLYALNTAGAVAGALATGFLWVPALGLAGTVALASSGNLAAAAFARAASRGLPSPRRERPRPVSSAAPSRAAAGVVLFATGAASIALEVGWTKVLAILTGATLYGFAAILAIFLSGLAAGSFALRRWMPARARPEGWLVAGLLLLAGLVLASRAALTHLPALADALTGAAPLFSTSLWLRCGLALPVLGPPAFVFGALFPLSLALYCGDAGALTGPVGRGTAINTGAGIVGSLVAGLLVIPRWGTDVLLAACAMGLALASLVLLPALGPRRRALALAAVALALLGALAGPRLDYRPMISAVRYRFEDRGQPAPEFLFLQEGLASVVSVSTRDGETARLESNGVQESWWRLGAPDERPLVELLLGLAPVLLHEAPASAFVVGFGAGHTVEALTWTGVERIRVVELEPTVVEAVRRAGGDVSALADPRVELAFNDARNALIVERASYDLVLSQPSHPWLSGSGNLFTREFFAIVASRLSPGGIHGQWLNLFHMDEKTLGSILAAFFGVHAHGLTLVDSSSADLLLIGSNAALRIDYERMQARMGRPEVSRALESVGFRDPRELLRYLALSRREALRAAGGAAPNSDLRLLTESRLARPDEGRGDPAVPLALLFRHFGLDLGPFFPPSELPRRYYEAGRFLAARGAEVQAGRALEGLRRVDPALAALLERDLSRGAR